MSNQKYRNTIPDQPVETAKTVADAVKASDKDDMGRVVDRAIDLGMAIADHKAKVEVIVSDEVPADQVIFKTAKHTVVVKGVAIHKPSLFSRIKLWLRSK